MEKYLTSEQVASLLQVHPFTVLKYLKSGRLEGVKIGRVYRVKESDVEKFLNSSIVGNGKNNVSDHAILESISRKTEEEEQKPEQVQPQPQKQSQEDTHEVKFQDDEPKDDNVYYKI